MWECTHVFISVILGDPIVKLCLLHCWPGMCASPNVTLLFSVDAPPPQDLGHNFTKTAFNPVKLAGVDLQQTS